MLCYTRVLFILFLMNKKQYQTLKYGRHKVSCYIAKTTNYYENSWFLCFFSTPSRILPLGKHHVPVLSVILDRSFITTQGKHNNNCLILTQLVWTSWSFIVYWSLTLYPPPSTFSVADDLMEVFSSIRTHGNKTMAK